MNSHDLKLLRCFGWSQELHTAHTMQSCRSRKSWICISSNIIRLWHGLKRAGRQLLGSHQRGTPPLDYMNPLCLGWQTESDRNWCAPALQKTLLGVYREISADYNTPKGDCRKILLIVQNGIWLKENVRVAFVETSFYFWLWFTSWLMATKAYCFVVRNT